MERRVRSLLKETPAVVLLGPRQSGKTTLSTQIAGPLRGHYFDLELETDRLRLDLEWEERVRGSRLVVMDEARARRHAATRCAGRLGPGRPPDSDLTGFLPN
jgi:hypothetical protein